MKDNLIAHVYPSSQALTFIANGMDQKVPHSCKGIPKLLIIKNLNSNELFEVYENTETFRGKLGDQYIFVCMNKMPEIDFRLNGEKFTNTELETAVKSYYPERII